MGGRHAATTHTLCCAVHFRGRPLTSVSAAATHRDFRIGVLLAYWEKRERGLCSLGP